MHQQTFSLTVNPSSGGTVLLEDFATLRNNGDGTALFSPYLGEDPGQTGSLDAGAYKVVVGGSNGIYFQCMPRSGGYSWPNGYAQH